MRSLHRAPLTVAAALVAGMLTAPAAAEVEAPPPPVCGELLTSDAALIEDLPCDLEIGAPNVTLNLNGHAVLGVVIAGGPPVPPASNFYVHSGTVYGLEFRSVGSGDDLVVQGDVFVDPAASAQITDSTVEGNVEVADTAMILLDSFVSGEVSGSDGGRFERNVIDGGLLLDKGGYTVRGNRVGGAGIRVGVDREVVGNLANGSATGIHVHGWEPGSTDPGSVIRGNTVVNTETGIYVDGRLGVSIAGLQIEDNDIRHSGSTGIAATLLDIGVHDVLIAGNRVVRSGLDGIRIEGVADLVAGVAVANNHAVNTGQLGIYAPGVIDGHGNHAVATGDRAQCEGVVCTPHRGRR